MENDREKVLVRRIRNQCGRIVIRGSLYIAIGVMRDDLPHYKILYDCDDRKHLDYNEPQTNFQLLIS